MTYYNFRYSHSIRLILYNVNKNYVLMGKRDPNSKFTDVACPNVNGCE